MLSGIIEGFYGPPWSWTERLDVARWCADRGMDTYVYAPKDDPKHREAWRDPYDADEMAAFASFVEQGGLRLGFAVSPGLSFGEPGDAEVLVTKCRALASVGVDLFVLAVDDIPPSPGLGRVHGELGSRMAGELGADVVVVPTDYTSVRPTRYLDDLSASLDPAVGVAWTGPTVVCDAITVEQADARAAAVGGRRPVLWDNYPVNDAVMADRLFLGPLRGRPADLPERLDGYVANPMVQARANLLPLASTAAWLRGEDPEAAWRSEAERLGWRVFAEACDGEVPRALVGEVVSGATEDALAEWLDRAAACEAPGLEGVVDAWIDQVHREARLARDALRSSGDAREWLGVLVRWRAVQTSTVTVMGPRLSVRPVVGQDDHGGFVVTAPGDAVSRGLNAVDALLAHLTRPRR